MLTLEGNSTLLTSREGGRRGRDAGAALYKYLLPSQNYNAKGVLFHVNTILFLKLKKMIKRLFSKNKIFTKRGNI